MIYMEKYKKDILLVLVGERMKSAVKIQEILTESGCFIKTRLGVHDGMPQKCTSRGLIILELVGDKKDMKKLANKLDGLYSVKTKLVSIAM